MEQLSGRGVAQSSHSVDLSWDRGDGNDVAGAAIALIIIFEAPLQARIGLEQRHEKGRGGYFSMRSIFPRAPRLVNGCMARGA